MSKKVKVKVGKRKGGVQTPKLLKKGLRMPTPVPPPHPSGMAEPPMSKEDIKEERRREVAQEFFILRKLNKQLKRHSMNYPKIPLLN